MKILLLLLGSFVAGSDSIVNKVVDLSHWNTVDLKLVKEGGVLGVIHKATQGERVVDSAYHERRAQAEALGLLWGAYHFGEGGLSGVRQADHFLETVGDISSVLLVLDLESYGDSTMSLKEAEKFVVRLQEKTGRYPLIFGSPYFLSPYIGRSEILKQCKLWVAHYTAAESPKLPEGKDSWLFWQYTNGAVGGNPRVVKGIGACDRNRFNGNEEELINMWPFF